MSDAFVLEPELMSPVAHKARQEWIRASRFHDLPDHRVLDEVLRVTRESSSPRHVLLDLDSTLYEVAPRSFEILREWDQHPTAHPFERVREILRTAKIDDMGYSLRDTFATLGLNLNLPENKAAFQVLKPFWTDRFFSNEYLLHDRPYSGAQDFVHDLVSAGARIVYLTGRNEPGMGRGTREVLARDGFPVDPKHASFFLKESRQGDDDVFKANAARAIHKQGPVLASFENEPKNLVALHELFPEAMHVFVETVCSDNPAEPREGLYKVRGFQRLTS